MEKENENYLKINDEVYVYNNIAKRITKGIIKRINITIEHTIPDIMYTIVIPSERPYAINMNEDFVWANKDEIIDFATDLIKDL